MLLVLLLALPVLGTRLGTADASTAPKDSSARKAYDLLTQGFGPGFNGPIPVVVEQGTDPEAAQKVYEAAKQLPESAVAFVQAPILNDAKDVGLVMISPATAPQATETDDLIKELRDNTVPGALGGSDARAYVSGQNAAFIDIGDRIYERAPWFLLYIIGVTLIVLTMAFRSVVIALKASITTLLSATRRVRRADLRRQAGQRPRADRPRPHGPDRELRAADRVRDPVRALDGLRGVPHEPDPRGAHPRQDHQGSRPRPASAPSAGSCSRRRSSCRRCSSPSC